VSCVDPPAPAHRAAEAAAVTGDPADVLRSLLAAMVGEAVERRLAELLPEGSSPWMTAEECAAYIRAPVKRVRNLTCRGAIPVVREGRRVLYDRREIDEWLRGQSESQWR
jgi:excisionase family DNA binding protein